MNLVDFQIELREIEKHISTLQTEIEKMKPQLENKNSIDFEKITRYSDSC